VFLQESLVFSGFTGFLIYGRKSVSFLNKPLFSEHKGELKMTERMITADCIDAVAIADIAETLVKPEASEETVEETTKFCVSDGRNWHPVEVPAGAGIEYLKKVTGAMSVQELQYDVAGGVYKEAEALKEGHVYEIFPVNKLAGFVAEHGMHR
jgi:hypothetical protein